MKEPSAKVVDLINRVRGLVVLAVCFTLDSSPMDYDIIASWWDYDTFLNYQMEQIEAENGG